MAINLTVLRNESEKPRFQRLRADDARTDVQKKVLRGALDGTTHHM